MDFKEYIKAKRAPTMFLLGSVEETRRLAFEMLKLKMDEDIKVLLKKYEEQIDTVIEEVIHTVAKGDKGDSPTNSTLKDLISSLIPPPLKGDPGYTPIKGKDYFDGKTPILGVDFEIPKDGYSPTIEELKSIIKPLIPIIPKPIPRSSDTGKEIVDKINELSLSSNLKIDASHIKNLPKAKEKGGGGMGNVQHELYNTGATTTSVQTNYKIAGSGNALWVLYNGQGVSKGTHYTIGSNNRTISFTFALDESSTIDLTYIRTS